MERESDKQLFNISPKECLRLYPLVWQNSRDNSRAAKVLAANDLYGQGTALAMISMEEMIKCVILALDGNGFNFRSAKGVSRFFKEHNIRYYTGLLLMVASVFGEDVLTYIETVVKNPAELIALDKRFKVEGEMEKAALGWLRRNLLKIMEIMPFFSSMDKNRQRGFYCDYVELFQSPSDVTEKQYLVTVEILEKVNKVAALIIGMLESTDPEIRKHIASTVNQFKEKKVYEKIAGMIGGMRTDDLFAKLGHDLGDLARA
jgi:AbiV family abortive infection protein